jgi:hypothetical protein
MYVYVCVYECMYICVCMYECMNEYDWLVYDGLVCVNRRVAA